MTSPTRPNHLKLVSVNPTPDTRPAYYSEVLQQLIGFEMSEAFSDDATQETVNSDVQNLTKLFFDNPRFTYEEPKVYLEEFDPEEDGLVKIGSDSSIAQYGVGLVGLDSLARANENQAEPVNMVRLHVGIGLVEEMQSSRLHVEEAFRHRFHVARRNDQITKRLEFDTKEEQVAFDISFRARFVSAVVLAALSTNEQDFRNYHSMLVRRRDQAIEDFDRDVATIMHFQPHAVVPTDEFPHKYRGYTQPIAQDVVHFILNGKLKQI